MRYEGYQFPNSGYPTDAQWAYLAGICDGEGCILVNKYQSRRTKEPTYVLRLIITQKNRNDLLKLQRIFGGNMGEKKKESANQLSWDGLGASVILVGILPHSLWKADQILLGLKFFHQATTYGGGYRQNKQLAAEIRQQLQDAKAEKYGRLPCRKTSTNV